MTRTEYIDEVVDHAVKKASEQMLRGDLNLRSVIYAAVQAGMRDAYERGKQASR